MSTLIYCQNSIAASPYYIEEASLNIYSLEELSYYMLNNVYLISSKLMNQELCNWIGRELKLKKLANELLELVQSNAPLHIFVGHILSSNGYASAKEIKDLLTIISTFENKSEAERRKMRADRLMQHEKYVDAIYEYETLLAEDVAKAMPKVVEGDVYHNLGCAFARLFFFDEAIRCFDEAYKRNQKKQSLYNLLYAARCAKDRNKFEEYSTKYLVPQEYIDEVLKQVSVVTTGEDIIEFDKAINDMARDENRHGELTEMIHQTVSKWKDEYIKFSQI